MPKVLVDVEERILDTAMRHFQSHGYEKTEMKTIARELKISVGTLYNKYRSKPDLFLAATKRWHEEMSAPLQTILEGAESPSEKIILVMESLLINAESFIGLWKDFMMDGGLGKVSQGEKGFQNAFKAEEALLHGQMHGLVVQELSSQPGTQRFQESASHRFTENLISTSFFLAMKYPGEAEKNRAYIRDLVEFLFRRETV